MGVMGMGMAGDVARSLPISVPLPGERPARRDLDDLVSHTSYTILITHFFSKIIFF
jgi:hypothetical protein